ncbi:MAG: OmpH family outer membrane protein [Erythrobacter sp.]
MKTLKPFAIPAALAASIAFAAPAAAQVQGPIATVDMTNVIVASNARAAAYNQVPTTYATQIEAERTKTAELQEIYKIFDKNKDNQIDDAELAAAQKLPQYPRAQALEQEISQLSAQVEAGLMFAVEQIMGQMRPAIEQAAKQKKVEIVLQPSAVVFAPTTIDITQDVINALNARLPTVTVVPPADWQPSQRSAQMLQEVEQRLRVLAALQQRQQQAQSGAAPAQGNDEAPVGR